MSEIAAFIAQTIRIAIPYLFAASGGVVAERAGVVSLTLEGFMLTGAFAASPTEISPTEPLRIIGSPPSSSCVCSSAPHVLQLLVSRMHGRAS